MFENWRFNPFTGTMNEVSITDEQHTVEYHADWNAYGIQLDEAPQLDNPSTVSIVESGTGGATFAEVPRTQAPSSGQYRVDYDAATYFGTGRIEFNSADNGKTVLVSYKGGGWIVKNQYRAFQTYLLANLHVTEDADIDGDLNVDGTLTVDGASTLTGAVSAPGGITGDLTGNVTGNVTGNLTGDVTGDVTGNADTATQADNATTADGINETGAGSGVLHWKIIEIGDWDMDTLWQKSVAHGFADIGKIVSVSIVIRDDSSTSVFPLGYINPNYGLQSFYWIDENNVVMNRVTGGVFDSSSYNATSFNRGYITIGYID